MLGLETALGAVVDLAGMRRRVGLQIAFDVRLETAFVALKLLNVQMRQKVRLETIPEVGPEKALRTVELLAVGMLKFVQLQTASVLGLEGAVRTLELLGVRVDRQMRLETLLKVGLVVALGALELLRFGVGEHVRDETPLVVALEAAVGALEPLGGRAAEGERHLRAPLPALDRDELLHQRPLLRPGQVPPHEASLTLRQQTLRMTTTSLTPSPLKIIIHSTQPSCQFRVGAPPTKREEARNSCRTT